MYLGILQLSSAVAVSLHGLERMLCFPLNVSALDFPLFERSKSYVQDIPPMNMRR